MGSGRAERLGLVLVLALSACSGEKAQSWESCQDFDCHLATAEQRYESHPQEVVAYLQQINDPFQQAAFLKVLTLAAPGDANQLCSGINPNSPAGTECRQLNLRPHLYEETSPASEQTGRVTSRPAVEYPAFPESIKEAGSLLQRAATAEKERCGDDPVCLEQAGHRFAKDDDPDAVADLCRLSWPEGSARDECMFRGAEAVGDAAGVVGLPEALTLCRASDSLARPCMMHALMEVLPDAPPAQQLTAQHLEPIIEGIEGLERSASKGEAAQVAQWLWSGFFFEVYKSTTEFALVDEAMLPEEARPHYRLAAAWRLLEMSSFGFGSVDEAVGVLMGEQPLRGWSAPRVAHLDKFSPRWSRDQNELDAELPATWALQAGRRTLGEDRRDDFRIAVLEAAARATSLAPVTVFSSMVDTQYSERVRWTAARLYDQHPQGINVDLLVADDPSELVQSLVIRGEPPPGGPPAPGGGPGGAPPPGR